MTRRGWFAAMVLPFTGTTEKEPTSVAINVTVDEEMLRKVVDQAVERVFNPPIQTYTSSIELTHYPRDTIVNPFKITGSDPAR